LLRLRTLLLLVAMVPRLSAAQTSPDFSVTVTESSELVEAVGTTRRIGRAELEARNARTLDDALRLLPGVHVRTGGDGTPRIDVRGFRSRHVLLLINGVPANSTADGQFDPARIPTASIREIKVSYSSSSLLYGDNAMAAVIEITTMDGEPDARLEVNGGTPDQQGAAGRFARTVGNWSLAATAMAFDTSGFRLPGSFTPTALEDGGRRQNSDRDRRDVRGSVGYRFSPAVSLASEWSFGTGQYGVPGSTINDPADIFAQTPRFERVEDYRAASGQVSLNLAPWRRFNVRGWVYRNAQREDRSRYDDDTYSSMDDPLVSGTFQSRERTTVTGSSALGRLDLGRLGWLRLSVNQRREAFDSNGVIRDVAVGGSGGGGGGGRGGGGNQPATFNVRAFSIDRHVDVYSSGAEWQMRPAPRVGVVLGASVNLQQRPDTEQTVEPTWIAGLSFDATAAVRLHASVTRKVRVPSIDQLFNSASGNPALRAEHAYGLDTGVDYRIGKASTVGVSFFDTEAHDFIERFSGQPFENGQNYRFRGAELTIESAPVPSVNLTGAYSFLDADDVAAHRPLQTRPRHRGSLAWVWTPVARSAVRGAVSRTGSQLYDSRGAATLQRTAGGYSLVDVGFTQTLARRVDLALDVTNLFDRLYDQAYALPREGRMALMTLRVGVK
jgi:outer membrane cobalamin receptor